MARAITSLPVPVSPRSSTALSTGATIAIASGDFSESRAPTNQWTSHARTPSTNRQDSFRRPSDVFQQVAAIERLHQEGNCAVSQCLVAHLIVIMGRDQDDGQLTPFASNPPLQLRPIHAGQADVCDDARHARQRARQQKRFSRFEADGPVSGGFEDTLNGFANTAIVIDGCNDHIQLRHRDATFFMRRIVRTARMCC
jgi:hypothetical protein